MAATPIASTARDDAGEFQYQPVPASAVASVVIAGLSTMVFLAGRESLQAALILAPLPLIGTAIGWRAVSQVKRSAGQLGGYKLATLGMAASLFCLVGGVGFAGYVFVTELPDGYVRTAFTEFQPDEVDLRGGKAVPDKVAALDGKKVFIKGYMRPDSTPVSRNVKQFLLVRDSNTCCFGDIGTVKYYDQVGVKVGPGMKVDYKAGIFRIGGVLHVEPSNAHAGVQNLVFTLDADFAK
jgi:hypothetical protein